MIGVIITRRYYNNFLEMHFSDIILFYFLRRYDNKSKMLESYSDYLEIAILDLYNVFTELSSTGPTMVIANTIKGYGLPIMENNPEWHHKFPSNDELNQMLKVFK